MNPLGPDDDDDDGRGTLVLDAALFTVGLILFIWGISILYRNFL